MTFTRSFVRAVSISAPRANAFVSNSAGVDQWILGTVSNRLYGWFTEGFDTLDLKEAKALLEELAA